MTPKYYSSILVVWVTKHLMQLYSESVQVANMQRSKIGMESIVE